jgi:hypothetical protein
LNLDAPFIAAYKSEIDKVKNMKRLPEQDVVHEPIPTALTIPIDSIAGKKLDTPDGSPWGDKPVFE